MNEDIEAIRVMGFWYWLWCRTGYRPFQRFIHRHNWCHMRQRPMIEHDRQDFHCDWCGAHRTDYLNGPVSRLRP